MTVQAIHHVQLPFAPTQRETTREFYRAQLGLSELSQPAGATLRFIAGKQRIDLVPSDALPSGPVVSHIALEVQQLPQLRSKLLAAGHVLDESRPLPGYFRFYVNDPSGNTLEFLEPDIDRGHFV